MSERGACLFTRDGAVWRAEGRIVRCERVADVPPPDPLTIALVPFAQVRERGFDVVDDGAPILALVCDDVREAVRPDGPELLAGAISEVELSPSDEQFAATVQRVIDEEIGEGEGSNFLLARRASFTIADFGPAVAEQLFWRLHEGEPNAYRSFCFRAGGHHWIGASPERNVTVRGGTVTMNPICGTLPLARLRSPADLRAFLTDPKEIHELFQVLDEELKMMAQICEEGGRVVGPFLKRMASVVHTEYELEGRTTRAPLDVFELSMFAPTMIGSPLQNAARVVAKHERAPRGYYSSAILFASGDDELDSAITIRTVHVDPDGAATVFSGASVVRDSVPEHELLEVRAKADAVLGVLRGRRAAAARRDAPEDEAWVAPLLAERNEHLSQFWLTAQGEAARAGAAGPATIVDFDDSFGWMASHMLRHLGFAPTVAHWSEVDVERLGDDGLVVLGPGPGNPLDTAGPKLATARRAVERLLERGDPFLAICLSHQVLCSVLGLRLQRLQPSLQGVQRPIDFFGRLERVGLYNTFAAVAEGTREAGDRLQVAQDETMVYALRGPTFESFQFHVESVLTTGGLRIVRDAVARLLPAPGEA